MISRISVATCMLDVVRCTDVDDVVVDEDDDGPQHSFGNIASADNNDDEA
jgi:hypothetical protein